jgi:N-acyl-D-amino-acid deacylase
MKKWLIIGSITIFIAGFTTVSTGNKKSNPEEIKKAINKSLPLLQSSSHLFLENAGGCHSCHHQDLGAISLSMAKEKGFSVNDTLLHEALESITNNNWNLARAGLIENDDVIAIIMIGGYDLWALSANHYPSNKTIDLLIKNLMQRQTKEGCWVSPNPRPPLEYYSFTATALMVKGLQAFAPLSMKAEVSKRVNAARSWLMQTDPQTNEEKVFQLLGLKWSDGDAKFIQQQAKKLLAVQHDDGGWSQLNSLQSDAYATGQNLYALNQAGQLNVDDRAFQKGISFLVNTQLDDGSWKVQTRS